MKVVEGTKHCLPSGSPGWRRIMNVALAGCFAVCSSGAGSETAHPPYRLGPEDTLTVRVLELDEIPDRPVRIDNSGFIDLPLAGRIMASGKTAPELEREISNSLRKFLHEPRVSVHVAEYRSQPVSVIGAVNTPGVHQLQGPKRVIEILSMAGGLRPEAGSVVQITRENIYGPLGIADAKPDPSGRFTTAEVDLDRLLKGQDAANNILVQPHDVVSVTKADIVYVIGEVRKSGGFTLRSKERLTLLQALALAEGLERTAAAKNAKVLRTAPGGGQRTEIPVNLSRILANQAPDIPLQADDILVVPNNAARSVAMRTMETALQIGTGVVIFRR